jgi:hypothetical protein
MDLIHREWKTDVTLTTDERGDVRARGFCGDYDLRVTHGNASMATTTKLTRGGAQVTVVLGD